MKILLINNNPVVSRLTALSARKEDIEIDEIQEVTELSNSKYDIVFVDADSWTKDVRDVITDNFKAQKSVLFYAEGDSDEKESFDLSILKPFLPSEVSAVIRSVEEQEEILLEEKEEIEHFDVLSTAKKSTKDDLMNLDLEEPFIQKIEKKEEVATVSDFDAQLEEAFPIKINTLDDDLFADEPKKEEVTKKEEVKVVDEDLFELDLNDELFTDNKKVTKEESKKEVETDKDDLLNFELLDNEFDLADDKVEPIKSTKEESPKEEVTKVETIKEESPKEKELVVEPVELLSTDKLVENDTANEMVLESDTVVEKTQVLDESEIENIKGLLSEDATPDMELSDLMPGLIVQEEEKKAKKKKSKKEEASSSFEGDTLLNTIASLPTESLKELLAGSKVKISIKFPKGK